MNTNSEPQITNMTALTGEHAGKQVGMDGQPVED